jgi:Ca2+-binding RTX toxin-like protein
LTLKAQPDYETKSSYSVVVSTTDSGGKTFADTLTISVTDVAESGAFGISSDTVTWYDYNPATSADITNKIMTSTSGSQVSLGNGAAKLNITNLLNLTDGSAVTTGKSPTLSFKLDTVPTGSGTATIKATIIEGDDGTRSGTEDMISMTVNVAYVGNGTTATLTVPSGTATGTYDKGDGTEVSFNVVNNGAEVFTMTAGNTVTGLDPSLDLDIAALYNAFISSNPGSADVLHTGTYSVAIETTLPLQNYANETVTKFTGAMELVTSTATNAIYGTDVADTVAGTSSAEVINAGMGKDTISTGDGAEIIVLASGDGSTTLANSNTVSDFTNGTDKFALEGSLTFSDLTVVADATSAADTVISITSTSEYLMTVTGVAYGYIDTNDFIAVADIA